MNPSIKEMVDAAVKEFEKELSKIVHRGVVDFASAIGLARTTLLSITEKAVASERARIREGVEKKGECLCHHLCPNRLSDEQTGV